MFLHSLRCNTDVTKRSAADIQKLFIFPISIGVGWDGCVVGIKKRKQKQDKTKQRKKQTNPKTEIAFI